MLVVMDINVLVSALWSRNGSPAKVMAMVLNGTIVPCYDYRILDEYRTVLRRPKFRFNEGEVKELIGFIETEGISVVAEPLDISFTDKADKKFYEVAKHCNAKLITGNPKHFPEDSLVITVADFLDSFTS